MKIIDRPNDATDPPGPAPARRARRGARVRLLACWPVAAVLMAAVLVAGCGSSSSGGSVAHIKPSTTANASAKAAGKPNVLAFAHCMRSHGVPNFPDPNSSGQLDLSGVNPQSPAFQTAANDCKSFGVGGTPKAITQTPQMQAAGLKMASCMRSHGVPNYPDGPITRSSGINESSPAFQRAFQTCRKYMSGAGQLPAPGGQVPVTPGG
jgi:hypothetical protein